MLYGRKAGLLMRAHEVFIEHSDEQHSHFPSRFAHLQLDGNLDDMMELFRMSMSDALAHSQKGSLVTTGSIHAEEPPNASLSNFSNTTSEHRAVKKRASKACHHCRAKKIKCSLVKSGSPCNTCQLDEVQCVVSKSRRNMTPRFAGRSSSTQSDQKEAGTIQITANYNPPQRTGAMHVDMKTPNDESLDPMEDGVATKSVTECQSTVRSMSHHPPTPELYFGNPHQPPSPASTMFHLPHYIRPPPPSMSTNDLMLLAERGVFSLPDPELRNELLRNYTNYVHPLLPMLDIHQFLNAISSQETDMRLSLMLVYAVMSAATSFVDDHILEAAGYSNKKRARNAFFQKTKLLYDTGYETDRLSVVQALLLMTYWYAAPEDQKDPSFWMGESLSHAYAIGLQQVTNDIHFDMETRRLRRRLWWCCYMRDQLITLSMRKPNRIKGTYEMPMLCLDDFETEAMDESVLRLFGDLEAFRDQQTRMTIAKLCIEKVKLSMCIQNILATQYTESIVKVLRPGLTPDFLLMLTPRRDLSEVMEVIKCEQLLDEWNDHLPQECYLRARTISEQPTSETGLLLVHRGILNMLYLAALSALHRPHIGSGLPARQAKPFNFQYLMLQTQRVKEAAREITEIVIELHKHNCTRFLPPVAITILMPAMTMHLLELKSSPFLENPSICRFQQCVKVLQTLQKHIPSGDFAYDFIDAAVQNCSFEIGQDSGKKHLRSIADIMSVPQSSSLEQEMNTEGWKTIDDFKWSDSLSTDQMLLPDTATDFAGHHGTLRGTEFFLGFDSFANYYDADTGILPSFE